jgi:hypothetical protein
MGRSIQIVRKKPKKKVILTSELVTSSGSLYYLSHEAAQKRGKSKKTPTAPKGVVGVFELKTVSYSMHEILPPSFTPPQ